MCVRFSLENAEATSLRGRLRILREVKKKKKDDKENTFYSVGCATEQWRDSFGIRDCRV